MAERPVGARAFVGRLAERTAIAACAEQAIRGRASVVWIEGEAGSGKTALVRQVVDSLPPDFTVVRSESDELTAQTPLAAAAQLGPLRSAEPFPAGMELLSHLGMLQEAGPVAVVVEDLHWADPASRLALLTVVRRLDEDRVLTLVTTRPNRRPADGWERLCQDVDRCHLVRLGALSIDEVAELAQRFGVTLTAAAAARLHRHTGGQPLYVRTLLSELTPEQLTKAEGGLPVPRSLASTTVARLAELAAESQLLAAALAVLNGRTPLPLIGRVAGLGQPTPALEELLATGFVTWWPNEPGTPVEFSHPLYRTAVYDDLSPTRRQQLHHAAAQVLEGEPALAHQVAAADALDETLAAEVAEASASHRERGALGQAATYLLWASSLTADRQRQDEWLLGAARLLLRDGQTARVAGLVPRLQACRSGPLRDLVLGRLAWDRGDAAAAIRWLTRAGGNGAPPDLRAEALALLGTVYTAQLRGQEALAAAREVLSLAPVDPAVEQSAWTALSLGQAMLHGAPAGLDLLGERLHGPADAVPAADAELLIIRGTLNFYAGRYRAAAADLRAAIDLAHHGATAVHLPRAHVHLAQALFEIGSWDDSLVQARVALSLTAGERTTWVEAQAHAAVGMVLACRGDREGAQEHIARGIEAAEELATVEAASSVQITQATLARAEGDPAAVVGALHETEDIAQVPMIASLSSYPALVMALLDCGKVAGALRQLAVFEAGAKARHLDCMARIVGLHASVVRCTGRQADAEREFRRAIHLFGPDDPLLDRARVHQELGRLLRDEGRRKEAVTQLRAAHELLAGVGAEPFRQAVAADLERCGIRSGVRRARQPLQLTDREQDVVALVAKGLTNREVATELYVSNKAVEYHLRNVFEKLGITSRRELRKLALTSGP